MRKFVGKFTRQIVAATLLVSLITPHVAHAQMVVSAPLLEGQTILSYIQSLLKVVFKNVAVVGAVNVSQQIARDAAESIASWVVEGAPGQNPLVYMKSPGDYIKDHTTKALGDVLDQMSEDFANASLLCISDPAAPLGILAGLYGALNAQANIPPFNNKGKNIEGISTGSMEKCGVGSIALSYRSLSNELSSEQLLSRFGNALSSGGTEVDAVINSQFQALTALITQQKMAEYERLATKSHQDLKSPISGEIRQPAAQIQEDAALNSSKFQMEQEAQMMSGILASGAEAIPAIFATTLANSLSKKLITRFKQGKGSVNPPNKNVNLANIFGAGKNANNGNGPGAIYSDVKTAVISEGELDLLTTFTACPDKFAQSENCVLDSSFAAAIRASDAGKTLTVKDALDQGKLHSDWELVPPSKTALNQDRLCYKGAYCFSNLSKLRKARIIPIGWEIAAATADGTGKVTLGEAVKGFNNCAYACSQDATKTCSTDADCGAGNTCNAIRDKAHPYCHLIDPNWVLKMPELVCRAKVFGPVPESELSANRQEQCVDQASCLAEDSSGQCVGAYGYCLRERNTFRFDAQNCPAQFAGCRLFNNKQFGQIGLVESTLSSAVCSDKNTGCLAYSAAFKSTGGYDETQQKIYLNAKAEKCDAKYAGCTEVQSAISGETQHLRLAPPTLGCKGLLSDPPECSQYAQSCTVDEVGCEVYQPVGSTDQAVPGIATFASKNANGQVIEWNDECSAECVGYASYYQSPTQTEPINPTPTAFIPKSAKVCTKDVVGCDAYVNIDSAAKAGGSTSYYSRIQKCSDPAVNTNHAVFYSWEGSDQAGYQLRQHDLTLYTENKFQVFIAGSPFYDVTDTELATLNAQCNEQVYKERVKDGKPNPAFNSDCRELFDAQGKAFYRLISKTLVSSAACTVFRKEKAEQQNCEASRGTFNETTGSCEYSVLPAGSTSCKAEFVGCRAYNGAASLSPKTVMNEPFLSASGWNGGELSSEGITVGDTVLKVAGSTTDHDIAINIGKTYSMILWAKGNGSFNVKFKSGVYITNDVLLNSDPLVLTPDWRRFEVSTAVAPWTDAKAKLVFEKTAGTSLMYLENIVIKEQVDIVYVIKDSWVTPAMCDANPTDNIPGPGLNCRQYKPKSDTKKPVVYLTGFTGLCREASAGCAKFVNTQNTKEMTERSVNFGTDATSLIHTIPADDFVYAVANSAAFCPADKKGCSALGLKVDGKTETVFRINNPEDYASTSCKETEQWCETFSTTDGQQRYFKYPDKSMRCEYHEKKEVAGVEYSGWFKEGTNQPCDPGFVSGGNTYGIYKNQDANYKGMTATCDAEFNQCTEFIDRADISKENPAGRPYYFMKNGGFDTASCNGKVSLKDGCAVLDDTSNGEKSISTLTTYCKSDPTMDPNCADILKSGGVAAGDAGKDGVLVAPVGGPKSLNPAVEAIYCDKAVQNGLFVATDCEAKRTKLADASYAVTPQTKPNILNLNCSNPVDVATVDNKIITAKWTCSPIANANTIVKVKRDRSCAEWLACQSSLSVFDKATQKYKEICTDLGVCNKLSNDGGAVGRCANWVTPLQLSESEKINRSLPLTTSRYVTRNVGWYGKEFSGYSLWHKFQPDTMGWFSKSQAQAESGNMLMGVGFEPKETTCAKNNGSQNGTLCRGAIFDKPGVPEMITNEFGQVSLDGVCYLQKCWYPLEGFVQKGTATAATFTESTCRGYPEQDAPFPISVIAGANIFGIPTNYQQGFQNSNVCEQYRLVKLQYKDGINWDTFAKYKGAMGENPFVMPNASCDCSYKKVSYGQMGETRYYSLDEAALKIQKETPVLARRKANEPGHIQWYPGKIESSSGDTHTVQYEDGVKEDEVASANIAYLQGDKSSIKIGDTVVTRHPESNNVWFEATVENISGVNIYVKFSSDLKSQTGFPYTKFYATVYSDIVAIKATQKSDAGVETPAGICSGGWFVEGSKTATPAKVHSKKGLTCSTDFDCIDERLAVVKPIGAGKPVGPNEKAISINEYQYSSDDGKCEFKTKETKLYGWKGYCLEKDFRTHINGSNDENACLTWLPIDIGTLDIYNQFTSAAFKVPASGEGRYYCVDTRGRMKKTGGKPSYVYPASSGVKPGEIDYLVTGEPNKDSLILKLGEALATAATGKNFDFTTTPGAAFVGFKDYGKAGLDTSGLANLKSREIDYIEVIATASNTYFPAGYTMKIQDDGIVRIYNYESTVNAWKKNPPYDAMLCPAWGVDVSKGVKNGDDGWGELYGYDYLDPKKYDQGTKLSILSEQVRCGENVGGTKNPCDYYQTGKLINEYFKCGSSEKENIEYPTSVNTEKRPMAITGVARTGTSSIDKKIYVPQLASPNSPVKQIWFVRIDNQQYLNFIYGYNGGGVGEIYNEFGNDTFKLGDMIHGTGQVSPTPKYRYSTCKSGDSIDDSTGLQQGYELRLVFGKDGEFLGIDAASCTQRKDATILAGWKVNVHVRDMCTQIVKTDEDGKNMAFTHRLWSKYPNSSSYSKYEDVDAGATSEAVTIIKNGAQVHSKQLFGSFATIQEPVEKPVMFTHMTVTEKTGQYFGPVLGGGDVRGYSCPTGINCLTDSAGTPAGKVEFADGVAGLHKLFAKFYKIYTTDINFNPIYKTGTLSSDVADISKQGTGQAPALFAFDPTTCSGARGGTCRLTRKYGMTINGTYDEGDVVFGQGSVAATMQFYGSADLNHMPIRRLKVNWGDGSQPLAKEGMYRNHKPVCSTMTKPAPVCTFGGKPDYNHTCSTDKDCVNTKGEVVGTCSVSDLKWSFGSWSGDGSSDDGACEPGFFQFVHAYTFTSDCGVTGGKALVADHSLINQYKLGGKIGIGERFCVFKPRVQLMDNWNVCNGETQGYGGSLSGSLKCNQEDKLLFTPFQGSIIVKE